MRIKELIRETGVSRETIHYYIREGLLPQPNKTSRNQADYRPEHIQRLQLIKDLQERYFLPLGAIKEIIQDLADSPGQEALLQVKTGFFQPLKYFRSEKIEGEKAFLTETGMSRQRLADFEAWKVINPVVKKGRKVYSQDDLIIGRIIGEMRRLGVSAEKGFAREGLKQIRDQLKRIAVQGARDFQEVASRTMTEDERNALVWPAIEIVSIFCYHLLRQLFRQEVSRHLNQPGL
ncbi:MAG: MerR family transcriptional regulator [Thermodesulfobacteriota bacterium]